MTAAPKAGSRAGLGQAWSQRMANSVLRRHAPSAARWHYQYGLVLKALERVWHTTGDDRYYRFIQHTVDRLVDSSGQIKGYAVADYNLDQINPGRALFLLERVTHEPRYEQAMHLLRGQLRTHPRTREGGFWHKQIYPHQMWLDGIYMAAPFYAEYAQAFDEPAALDDVAQQVVLIEIHTRDPRTGLLYHAWDESRTQRWANPETGCSPHFWGRAMGWYAMAIVDVLDYFPAAHPRRGEIVAILERLAQAIAGVQDASTGLWYQVLDQGQREGNYLEASASCMFVYALAKAARRGDLPAEYLEVARRGYQGILERLVRIDAQGLVNLTQVCAVAGLGGKPYRDGSYAYYVGAPVVTNDFRGVGAFVLAGTEMECDG